MNPTAAMHWWMNVIRIQSERLRVLDMQMNEEAWQEWEHNVKKFATQAFRQAKGAQQ